MIRPLLAATGLFLAALLLPSPSQADCWCHPDSRILDGNYCRTSWQGGRNDAPPNWLCMGDPTACFIDLYTNGFWDVWPGPPPLGGTQYWRTFSHVTPSPGAQACGGPLATPVATRWKTNDQVMKWQKKAADIRRQLVQSRAFMAYYCTQAQGLPHVKGMCLLFTKIVGALTVDLVAYVAAAMDPPNMDYAVIPALCTQSSGPPLTMADLAGTDGTAFVTAPQLAAINAWLAKRLEVDNIHCQMVDTWERTSGAVLAFQAGDVAAEPWIGSQAWRYDALKATVIAAASQERALRTAALAPFPTEPVPAACPEPAALERVIVNGVAAGMDVYQAGKAGALMTGPCVPATTWPAFLFADVPAEVALYADFATVSLAATVCAAGYCDVPAPEIGASPSTLAFGSLAVGATSAVQTVTVRNAGTAALVVGTLALTGTGAAHFTKTTALDLCTGATLVPAGTCTVGVRFKPTVAGSLAATLSVPSNVPTVTVALSGTGTSAGAPVLAFSPPSLTFPATMVGATSAAQTITVQNTGTAPLIIGALTLTGINPTSFTKTSVLDHCSGVTLQPTQTCTVGIRFKPLVTGALTARVRIVSNLPNVTVPLAGTGL